MAIMYETLCEADYKKGKELLSNIKNGTDKQRVKGTMKLVLC